MSDPATFATDPVGMPSIEPSPDFSRFRDTLLGRRRWARPPQFDFLIDRSHKQKMLGRPVETPADSIGFMMGAGYDYEMVSLYPPRDEIQGATVRQKQDEHTESHATTHRLITSLEQFRSRRWSWMPVAEGDLEPQREKLETLERAAEALPESMKLVVHTADTFTTAWEMMGFTEFCMASFECPELIREVMDSLHAATMVTLREGLRRAGDRCGAVMYSDDIAYTEGLMLGPEFYREFLFPKLKEIADAGRSVDAPLIYHSDGRLYPVFDDLAEAGVRGVQPLEPKSMEPVEIHQRWPGRFCLLGNIDLDLMARGTGDAVEAHVRDRIDRINAVGPFMPGVSNTVPDYVNTQNYRRMIETVQSYPLEEIG